jgi:hypothetical protein
MQWISVQDRLPADDNYKFCKTTLTDHCVCYYEHSAWEGDLRGSQDDPEMVTEWLDETPESAPTEAGRGEVWRKALEKIATQFDLDSLQAHELESIGYDLVFIAKEALQSTPTQTEHDSEMCLFAEWINECVMGYENEKGFYWNIHESPDEITHKHISTTDLLTAFRAQKKTTL